MTSSTPTASRPAWGWGLVTTHHSGQILDTWFRHPKLGVPDAAVEAPHSLLRARGVDGTRKVLMGVQRIEIDLDVAPVSVPDVYLRLHLLSHRVVQPRTINLDGIFDVLPNVVWTTAGPCSAEDFEDLRPALRDVNGGLNVVSVDAIPRMLDYVVPSGVRIADAARVRLGAYLAEGTTVMHEGFCNFNAGTLGASMVEGRISQGVIVGAGSDIGGGASIMGTLSGGGKEQITIGERCLLGANSGLGISLGNDCVVEAGLYVTAGTKVTRPDGTVVAARALSGADNMLLIRDSVTGAVLAKNHGGRGIRLNDALHKN